ncbi:MAG: putative toxin-antitoxin system toxin component, PIN family [Gemmatimonadota bacterium]
MRVCLDTNVLIAAFATRGLCADVLRAALTEHELVIGDVILTEFRRVLKSKLKVPDERIASAEAVFSAIDIVPKPDNPEPLPIRDRQDRWVLATAMAGEADVLVTGDSDLLDVAADAPLPILTPRAFWELLRRGKLG